MVYGIVLAGGYSSRMKQNKMLLTWGDDVLINQTVKTMLKVVDQVIVVTGHYHEEIVAALFHFPQVKVVRNMDYDKGMFSSVKKGVSHVEGDFFIVPGDYPMISEDVYQLLLNHEGEIRVPTFKGYKGHPIFLEQPMKEALLEFDDASNLKVFRDTKDVRYYQSTCEGIIQDIDTLQDYHRLKERSD